jgi:hypothetical protein
MTLSVTFQFRGRSEIHKRLVSSMKIDGEGSLILYDKDRRISENLTIAELKDLSIESEFTQAVRTAS